MDPKSSPILVSDSNDIHDMYTHLQSTSNIASGYGKSYLCKLSYSPDPGDRNCKANDAYDMCSYIRVRRYKHVYASSQTYIRYTSRNRNSSTRNA